MQTMITLDDQLLEEASRYAKVKNPDEIIEQALREFVHFHNQRHIRELRGQVKIHPNYNYKALRIEANE
ncbi:MAG: type II toxin-antitoxin system VapB family antitoxin [Thioploca sp.]|nr:type II toxin-antitoxin system VapB family antitoxin [Thioploca sp.]